MTLLSVAGAMLPAQLPGAVVANALPLPLNFVNLNGTARGFYAAHTVNPDTGTHFVFEARGRITPLGNTSMVGSFQTPGFILNGVTKGTITMTAPGGTLTLQIAASASQTTTNEIKFHYAITHGTGRFLNAHGVGTVDVVLRRLTEFPQHGGRNEIGDVTLTFRSFPIPLA
jgi:hypothetical protein